MKKINILLLFLLATFVFASCDTAQQTQESKQPTKATDALTEASEKATQESTLPTEAATDEPSQVQVESTQKSTEASILPSEATSSPTENQEPAIEVNPLILDNYDDYLLFRKGELKFKETEPFYIWYGNNPNVFIDFRTLLNLPELPEDFTEEIIIQTDDSVIYCVYSYDENGMQRFEYLVDVTYHPDGIVTDTSRYPTFDNPKENTENEKHFSVRKNESVLNYSQENGRYKLCCLNSGQYDITVFFYSTENTAGYTPEEIEEKCGKLVGSLFSAKDDEFSRGVETVTKAIGELSRTKQ